MTRAIEALAVACLVLAASSADARPRHVSKGIIVCTQQGCSGRAAPGTTHVRRGRRVEREDVVFIPNPPGTWRIAQSCAHRLAAYWGLGGGLDAVSTWPRVFARVSGPGVGIAAVRRDQGHVMGIIGGGPGAWRVADFNSGGHKNREYTISDFRGYFFVDPRSRVARR